VSASQACPGPPLPDAERQDREFISVVVPALDEAAVLPRTLPQALSAGDVEVILADGGSTDGTPALARDLGARVVQAPRGRARQMNAGAAAARGGILLFLHADTLLPPHYEQSVREILREEGVACGAFRLGIDGPGPGLRLVERFANLRSSLLGLPYGDQGIFVRRALFCECGGFSEIPIMEDFEFVRRLRRRGRIRLAQAGVRTSARRWEALGVLRTTLLNQQVVAGYLLGIQPERLARWYRGAETRGCPAPGPHPGP